MKQLDGLVAVPSLAEPRFMEAHHLATEVGLLPNKNRMVRTIDTGGAGPVSGLLEAVRMIRVEQCETVAVVAADAVSALPTAEFLRRADATCRPSPSGDAGSGQAQATSLLPNSSASSLSSSTPQQTSNYLPSPVIPHGYDRVAQWQMRTYGVTRAQLAAVSVLMSHQASHHPLALTKQAHTLEQVLSSPKIAPVTSLLECARRADGGAAVVVSSSAFMQRHGLLESHPGVVVVGGGECSGPLFPPANIDEDMFSCEEAARLAYTQAQLAPRDIDWWGLYDCFPICFIRAVEAVGLAPKGSGGMWVEEQCAKILAAGNEGRSTAGLIPINTHGGLLAFGAPWETPAMYNVIEGVEQIRGRAVARQVKGVRRALVYGNGGIFSHSSVAILAKPVDY